MDFPLGIGPSDVERGYVAPDGIGYRARRDARANSGALRSGVGVAMNSNSPAGAPPVEADAALQFLAGGGELGTRMRAHDWAATSLGPPADWPRSLKTAVRIMLMSRQPIWVGWGRDLIYLYNDPYKSIIGGKHPWALGRPASEVWRELWPEIGPMLATAMRGDEGTYVEEQLLIMERSGYPEETYYTFSYSPIPDDDGTAGGIICANTDDTRRVIGERQLALLRELAATTADARTAEQACERSARALATNTRDLPFAMIYLADREGAALSLAGAAGIAAGHPAAPSSVRPGEASGWPLADVMQTHARIMLAHVGARLGVSFPTGAWDLPPVDAALIPIPARGETGRGGVLVAGLNPFRLFDDDYRRFLELAAGEIGAAIANGGAYEEERRRAEALAEIDRAKTAFFSNVSHEFRTPLTLMLGPLEDAFNDPAFAALDQARQHGLTVVHRNALRLLKLVNSLLDFSRIEAGRVRASFAPTDLAAFTADLASNFGSATQRAGLRLFIDCPPLAQPVYVDRDMWEKIILNLLSNAFKFTFEGEIAVHIGVTPDRTGAQLAVRDTGTGISPDELPRLFERFHRIEGARGRSFEGSGIGLALVNELVKLHGGAIEVASEVGRGTTFTISLPFGSGHLPRDRIAAQANAPAPGTRAEAYVQEALRWLPGREGATERPATAAADDLGADAGAARARGERILLADDSADMREYMRRLLVDQGYAVEAVADGEAALAAARRESPALILSDVMMPGLDGFALLSALRRDPDLRELPVILLSARAGEEARVEGLEGGADDYVSKPFSARELLARVRANLQLAAIRREAEAVRREHAARLEAVVNTVPTAVWFTYDREAEHIFGNACAAKLLRLRPGANMSLTAPADERPSFVAFRDGREIAPDNLPLQRAVRGETLRDEEIDVRFADGSAVTLVLDAAPIRDAAGTIQGAVCGAIDITDRKRQQLHRELLLNELNHRVKNTLATVQSFAVQTLRNASTVDEGRRAFEARLIALSKAHDVLTRENWEGAGLGEVVAEALAAYAGERQNPRVRFSGDEIRLQPKTALAVSMALHELATNAVKYGALSNGSGRVRLDWTIAGAPSALRLRWVETAGPPVAPPRKRGFGSRLIEYGLSQDLGAEVRLDFAPGGVVCVITAPVDEIRATSGPGGGL
jgi:signal transduction histidine kinase/FixJ family two-component response regulator